MRFGAYGSMVLAVLIAAPGLAGSEIDSLAAPTVYAADFVATAAFGVAMNDGGDVTGTSYQDTGCGSGCLPPLDTVVWRGGKRIVLPPIPGLLGISVHGMNAQGWVAGFAGFPNTLTHAVVWKPNGDAYQAIDLGALPGTTISTATGIDDLGRVVGWSTTSNFPPNGSPFLWTESGGMVDLSAQGFPDAAPLALSPGGAVATQFTWYRLGDPTSVVPMPPPPNGYVIGFESTAINDAGDQGRFLISTSSQNLRYLFRFHHEGTWQQISFTGNGNVSYGVGSITSTGDLTATVLGGAKIAYGPDGLAQSLTSLLSPAYQGSAITWGGPMNEAGQVLAGVMIGQHARLMRLLPAEPCISGCMRSSALQFQAVFVPDPSDPDHCTPQASTRAFAAVTVTSETGAPLSGVVVRGRFLDDYWTNRSVSARTNGNGVASFRFSGPACIGTVAFLVDSAEKGDLVFDKTVGILTRSAVPQ
jgi:probable HAF family extracellular repeat protein